MPYDIGRITRELQQEFRLFKPRFQQEGPRGRTNAAQDQTNRATPENLSILLLALDNLTDQLEARRRELGNWTADAAVAHWDEDFEDWVRRLDEYIFEVSKAPPGDRQDVLWSVTAPLLLGFYGGENSKLPQQRIDAVTPFVLANQLEVDESWRKARIDQLWDDLEQGAVDVVKPAGIGLGLAIGAGVGFLILRELLS